VTVVTNHGLRHSFASLCYHLGISERQLMQWGGWADYQTMHKIYIRLAASDESKAAEQLTGFFTT
jgi:integrase